MTDNLEAEARRVAAGLTGRDADMIAAAWEGSRGRWYLDGPCKHLYTLGICRLTGVLEPFGLAVKRVLEADEADVRAICPGVAR